jgi:hypothetical protein
VHLKKFFFCRGDPAIVYLDGVTPPRHKMVVSKSLSSPGSLYNQFGKANSNHHQQLLKTIREDECESR